GASGTFSNMLLSIALGTKIVSRGVSRAGLVSMLGLTGDTNVQGEQVQKLDIYAERIFERVLGISGEFFSMVSEERESVIRAKEGDARSRYVVAFDPLDGSSNIDSNVSIGTIFGIYRRKSDGEPANGDEHDDFMQPCSEQVAAGYTLYGSSTMFVFTTGNGVHGFTLDPNIGEFILTHPNMVMPARGSIYSCNEAYSGRWSAGVQQYIRAAKAGDFGKPYSLRYVGSLVADFHRTVLKGGIFMYPAESAHPNGKLRLLYECAPLAMLAEQAGGAASNGSERILSMVPHDIHQRTPIFIGSSENVQDAIDCIKQHG
ncbi:MAG: class 1 fructose-bisphosphatase, partial [Bdellovibrionales bacterium]|nr:class 1 fructose-bisphosphatase [Bdellovibrionales bacterium]